MAIPPHRESLSAVDSPPSAGIAEYRDAMARLAGGVGLLATRDPVGRDCGITVTAVSSVSLDPPLVLVCVKRDGFIHDALYVASGWALTMLADDQVDVARYAARHRHPGDRDDFTRWPFRRGIDGALVLTGGVSAVECVPREFVDAGDHTVVIGRVVAAADDVVGQRPLVYADRDYHGLGPVISAERGASHQPSSEPARQPSSEPARQPSSEPARQLDNDHVK